MAEPSCLAKTALEVLYESDLGSLQYEPGGLYEITWTGQERGSEREEDFIISMDYHGIRLPWNQIVCQWFSIPVTKLSDIVNSER